MDHDLLHRVPAAVPRVLRFHSLDALAKPAEDRAGVEVDITHLDVSADDIAAAVEQVSAVAREAA